MIEDCLNHLFDLSEWQAAPTLASKDLTAVRTILPVNTKMLLFFSDELITDRRVNKITKTQAMKCNKQAILDNSASNPSL